ncbi:peptidoglycan DD-metalloendopeptidase family protein [Brevibacillus laterosporus]|uniref:murein hydrolase activator EnvC family protein n=1 Tax=Brevibacillus laterosporus TaxID=1465 RepID=UPI00215BF5BB|nr:M23 family metallopeptidase [Brevibacillus laterosporus]MCR8939495.1 peptidoglycan DD-metalloendopeptidase family protein [Brevibacillus laterosporus]MCZ0842135.1 peptidoglycan DD-metalloendopeptidase family protein [Brevibacillus laterosporus]MCZ0843769.1 peptidoglycan DD-metalloendopeptidase family protein [Brevibacillus laterosporus]
MKKNNLILSVLATSMLAWGLAPAPAGYASKKSLQTINRELEQIRSQKKKQQLQVSNIKSQINTVRSEQKNLDNELFAIDLKREETQQKLDKLDKDINATAKKAVVAQEDLDSAVDRVAKRDELLKTRVKAMYKRGKVSYLDVLMGSSDFGDLLTRMHGMKLIVEQDNRILEENKKDKQTIEKRKKDVDNLLASYKTMFSKSEDLKEELDRQYNRSVVVKAELKKKENDLVEIEAEAQEAMRAMIQAESAKLLEKQNLSSVSNYKGGKLGVPLDSFVLTSSFGYRADPFTGKSAGHDGLDMAAPKGTTIKAAEDGVVIFASTMRGYGNAVVIQHNNEISTLYGHIREGGIKVRVGQAVKRGEKIAEVGSTGRSTGNHLHFTVYKNNRPVDPAPYIR